MPCFDVLVWKQPTHLVMDAKSNFCSCFDTFGWDNNASEYILTYIEDLAV